MSNQTPARALLLGTFHFADKGRDMYKPQHHFDVAARQDEIEEVVKRLTAFAPTKIAVEVDAHQQSEIDKAYKAHLERELELTGSEVHQIGFKLAKQLGHSRIHAINDWGRSYKALQDTERAETDGQHPIPSMTWDFVETYARDHKQLERMTREIEPYLAHFAERDKKKIEQPLRQTLLEENDPQTILEMHGVYLVAHFKVGIGHEYPGVDAATAWYNRNLRIFANVQRITEPGDRLLIIYGAGHTALLRHCLTASPEYELVEVSDYL